MFKNASNYLEEMLVEGGVKRIYTITAVSLNPVN
jgi:hypothetical protein